MFVKTAKTLNRPWIAINHSHLPIALWFSFLYVESQLIILIFQLHYGSQWELLIPFCWITIHHSHHSTALCFSFLHLDELHSKKKFSGITLSNKLDLDGRLLYMGPNYIPIIRNYTEIILNYIKLYKVIQPWRVRFTKIIQYYICAI